LIEMPGELWKLSSNEQRSTRATSGTAGRWMNRDRLDDPELEEAQRHVLDLRGPRGARVRGAEALKCSCGSWLADSVEE
jgi:hypothetical protein